MKKVDVIIPAYNARETLFKALSSIACQKNSDVISVCIVDDASECSYGDIISKFSDNLTITCCRMDKNIGPGNCRQYGIDHTSCEYIAFLDADDQFFNQFSVISLLNAIESENFDYVISDFYEDLVGNIGLHLHQRDLTWMFSKIYRREFLLSEGIRFNENGSYANEDSGFNSIVTNLVKDNKMKYIECPTYIWSGTKDSITRANNQEYAYAKGFSGFIDNQIYAIEFLKKKENCNEEKLKGQIISNILTCFSVSIDGLLSASHVDKTSSILDISREYYAKYKDTIREMLVTPCFMAHYKRATENKPILPVSVYQFLSMMDEELDPNDLLNKHLSLIGICQ